MRGVSDTSAPQQPTSSDEDALAERIWTARRDGHLLDAGTEAADLGLATAYRVQRRVLDRWLSARPDDGVVGWKLGYTSRAMREQMGVDDPNYGPLLASMVSRDGEPLPEGLRHPRVEPEIALVMGADVSGPVAPERLRDAVAEVRAALEVVDSTWAGYRFTLPSNTADLSSAAGVVLGPALSPDVAAVDIAVDLHVDGRPVATATADAAMGGPLDALAWLVDTLAAVGEVLRAGSVVMTGGLTAAHRLDPGTTITANFTTGSRTSAVSVRR